MPHRFSRRARLTLTGVKLAVIVTLVAIGLLGSGSTTSAGPQPGYAAPHGYVLPAAERPTRTERLLDAHHCSTTGFEVGEQPLSALVRSAAGELRIVDFDTGWDIYTRHGAARLIAVCLAEPPD